ncbi:MAG TPA: glycosyltransferase family 39 protein [Ilumatobacteraceae bacterium]|nr:glycosyltransferase family 39 protein [Ilumatobacteraceae bacterium]
MAALMAPEMPRFRTRLGIVVAVGFVWRVGLLVADKWNQQLLFNDSIYYSAWAKQLTEGRFFRDVFTDLPSADHGPLTSALIAPLSWMNDPVPYQRLVTVVCGTATIAVIGLLGRAVRGERVGVLAAVIAALYPNLWINDGLVMSESVSVLTVSIVLLCGHRVVVGGHRDIRSLAVLGGVCGLAALARSELSLFIPLLALMVIVPSWAGDVASSIGHRLAGTGVMVATAIAVVMPWVVPNLVRFERPALLSTSDGTTLLGSYCDASFFGPNKGGWAIECVSEHPTSDPEIDAAVRNPRRREAALDYATDHLDDLPKVVAARVLRTADLYGIGTLLESDVGDERPRWAAWAGIVSWWVLAPLAIGGWFLLPARSRRLFMLPAVIVFAVAAVFYGGHRIRSTLEPVVVLCAAVTLVAIRDTARARSGHRASGPTSDAPQGPAK